MGDSGRISLDKPRLLLWFQAPRSEDIIATIKRHGQSCDSSLLRFSPSEDVSVATGFFFLSCFSSVMAVITVCGD